MRFVLLTPLSYCNKSVRSLVLEKISSFSIDPNYKRTRSSLNAVDMWQAQEIVTCLYGWIFVLLMLEGVLFLQDSWSLVHYFWAGVFYQLTTNVSSSLLSLFWGEGS